MTPNPITPALTVEEWAENAVPRIEVRGVDIFVDGIAVVAEWGEDREHEAAVVGRERHALAALCLYGQPYGFSHADVKLLKAERSMLIGDVSEEELASWGSLADRIEALLPPETP